MQVLKWTPSMWVGFDPMDNMNRVFMERLEQAQTAPDDQVVETWRALVDHTTQQFGTEDRWMHSEAFATAQQHTLEHRVVLNLLREGLAQARRGDLAPARQMADELGAWFSRHTQSLDAALALHMRRVSTRDTAPA